MPNRLSNETSPYLLQHRDNPVDWYPWGPEALERARAEDRPLLLSVGYSACHWCHVMEHESFEDEETARLMNEHFVNVKVDREERPDVDSIYMAAVQQMTGHGGWPMTVFLTPEGEPFYGGTYYPPEPRHGLPSFRQVLGGVAQAWAGRRDEVVRSAGELAGAIRRSAAAAPAPGPLDAGLLDRAFHALGARFDAHWGGFGGAPKFPQPMNLEFLLRTWRRTGSAEALHYAEVTLRRMAAGGIYDHVGGGFARYAVDERWLVPHFEKMLYDNALLARAYLQAWQATGEEAYRAVTEDVLGYLLREMRAPEGGFYSSQDADSEGEEGRFYVWTPAEIDQVLGAEDGALVRRFYGVTDVGNFEGRNILHAARGLDEAAAEAGVAPERMREALERARPRLYEAREKRVRPGRDDKVIAAWNAMAIHAFAEAGIALGRADLLEAAQRAAAFVLEHLHAGGRLLRTWKDGRGRIPAFLEDHALLADSLAALYEADFDPRWLDEAGAVADAMLERFWDEERGVFHDTADDAEALIVRPRDVFDNATPAGNSAAVTALQRLAALRGEPRYARAAARVLEGMAELLDRVPAAFGHLLCGLDFHLAVPRQVAFAGSDDDPEAAALVPVAARAYLPNTIRALRRPGDGDQLEERIPLLRGRTPRDGRAAAYVCERFTCREPVTAPEALAEALGAAT
jgi:uncharacterized protein